jgi:hypothetical protein
MGVPAVRYQNLNLLVEARRWEELLELATREEGVTAGERREVSHVLAVEAPAPIAAGAAELFPDDDNGFPGPLWEVVAHHSWDALAPHLTNPRTRYLVAQTRVLHGDDLRRVTDLRTARPGAPLVMQSWEAAGWDSEWNMPTYDRTGSSRSAWGFPWEMPDPVALQPSNVPKVDHAAVAVLDELSGAAQACAFEGTAWEAAWMVAEHQEESHAWKVPFSDAYPHLVSLAAGERAYDHATGQALGRIAVWRALTAMAGTPWAGNPQAVTAFVERLRCVAWRFETEPMWFLRLAMEDPEQGVAWVLTGHDSD